MAEKRRGGDRMGREWHCGRESGSSPGCMGGMFHHLHFHHLLFAANSSCCRVPSASSPSSSSSSSLPSRIDRTALQEHKGLEAPRNSLELDGGKAPSSASSAMDEEFKDVPVAVEIVPPPASLSRSTNKTKIANFAEEKKRPSCSSQAETPRMPSIVARLMGLEISAEQSPSPTPKTPPLVERRANTKKMNAVVDYQRGREPPRQPLRNLNCNSLVGVIVDLGSRSLPESPRTLTSAISYDVDRRLSLQIYRENMVGGYSFPPSPSPPCSSTKPKKKDSWSWRCANDENKNHIVKKVNESLNDETKSKTRRTRPPEKKLAPTDPLSSSIFAPQIRFSDFSDRSNDDKTKKRPLVAAPKPSKLGGGGDRDHGEAKVVKVVASKCKKADHERFTGRIKNQAPNSPYSSRSFPTLETLFQATPDQRNLPDRNYLSSSPSIFASSRIKEASHQATSQPLRSPFKGGLEEPNTEKNRPHRAMKNKDPEFIYIRSILEHAKIAGALTWRWYSRSLPIDPVVFHRLELDFPFFLNSEGDLRRGSGEEDCATLTFLGQLRHRWNRKLLFHLVQEILGDLLVGSSILSSFSDGAAAGCLIRRKNRSGSTGDWEALLQDVLERIDSFPAADCRVLGDIDALVAGDMAEAKVRRLPLQASMAEEAGEVLSEVEREILDCLLGETAASLALTSPPSTSEAAVGPSVDRPASAGESLPCSLKRRGRG